MVVCDVFVLPLGPMVTSGGCSSVEPPGEDAEEVDAVADSVLALRPSIVGKKFPFADWSWLAERGGL